MPSRIEVPAQRQSWNPESYARNAGFVATLGAPVLDLLDPRPGDLPPWLDTFGESFLDAVPPEERPAVVAEVREAVAPKLRNAEGTWTLDYVRLRFAADKPI